MADEPKRYHLIVTNGVGREVRVGIVTDPRVNDECLWWTNPEGATCGMPLRVITGFKWARI